MKVSALRLVLWVSQGVDESMTQSTLMRGVQEWSRALQQPTAGAKSDETIPGESQSVELWRYDPKTARMKRVVRFVYRLQESRLKKQVETRYA